ncbi:serine/threonine-protein kinase 36 isoform X3 [Oryzias melastigma]|nr:serine/threonine-protein kinase 36 isoform X3 [Oryzias melastigma]
MNSYHVLELAGEGSFGRVHKGRKKGSGQVVALKFMPKVGRTDKELRSLKREIEIMRNLKHPNIVQLFDSFETDTEVVVVTEYAEGQLFQVLEDDGNLPESLVREIACQLVSALYYLHSHRILHRDMKPQNILLGKSGVVKLCDFGFARAMSASTLVLTSIKGTPLYMSPELVEEKPYDHTADLWSLGCILYELHTGAPPFYTNSIFHLVQLIVKDQVKWPDTMSDACMSFLKGLLTKDPEKRLSWPDLLHHPFVADGVLAVLSDTDAFSPLTVTPSPDVLARKQKQVAEKSAAGSGESRLLRKVREQMENKKKPTGSDSTKIKKDENRKTSTSATSSKEISALRDASPQATKSKRLLLYSRGQISRDYEQEFPGMEVGPRLLRRNSEICQSSLHRLHKDSTDYWEILLQQSDPSTQQREPLKYNEIIPQIKSRIEAFKAQLTAGSVKELQQIQLPLKVLRNLILMSDLEKSDRIGTELQLPHLLFDLIHKCVDDSDFIKQRSSVPIFGELMALLLVYWEKHQNWMEEEESRLEEFIKPFSTILAHSDLLALAPLAASVLSLFTQHVDVPVDVKTVTSSLKTLLSNSFKPHIPLPCGWGLCDGLLCLLLHALFEHEKPHTSIFLSSDVFVDLWKTLGNSLGSGKAMIKICSANGLQSFLSLALYVFTLDPYSCVPLFIQNESKCVHTLGRLLGPDSLDLFTKDPPGRSEKELSCNSLTTLSCHLLCFPFALDLPPLSMSSVLQVYDSCGITSSLLQVVQTLPLTLLELPLSLLSRLLICDPERSLPHLRDSSSGLFSPPREMQSASCGRQTALTRTPTSLLSELLQVDGLWDAAVELLTVLSQIARFSPRFSVPLLHVEVSVLEQGLTHPYDQIRVATCRFLGHLDPFVSLVTDTLPPDLFRVMIDCLRDPYMPVRRSACRAVGNWLGHIAERTALKTCTFSAVDTTGRGKIKDQSQLCYQAVGGDTTMTDETDEDVGRGWTEEAKRSVTSLAGLLSDSDAVTRRHCCVALGNLVKTDGAASLLVEEDVPALLLRAACADSHHAVKQAAISTLSLYRQQDAMQQVLASLDASKKLLQALHDASLHNDHKADVAPALQKRALLNGF